MKIARRAPLVTLAALVLALSVAACGGSSGGSSKSASGKNAAATTTTKSGASAAATAFTNCLKQHGVTLPKRRGGFGSGTRAGGYPGGGYPGGGYPGGGYTRTGTTPGGTPPTGTTGRHYGPGGAGGFFGGAGGLARGNSKFAKAFQACRSKLPKGLGSGRFRGRFGARPGAGAGGPLFSTAALKSFVACVRKNGYPAMPEPKANAKTAQVFPSSVEKNPKFEAASRKCESILRQAFRPPAASGGQTTTPTTSSTASTSSA